VFVIANGAFSHVSVDKLKDFTVPAAQAESGGFSVHWQDRFAAPLRQEAEMTLFRHLSSGREIWVANTACRPEDDGRWGVWQATDYHLGVAAGERVKLVRRLSDRVFAKKGGKVGWVLLPTP
jgi:hypothetical protein